MSSIEQVLGAQLNAALWECCPPGVAEWFGASPAYTRVVDLLREDALTYAAKDPAAHGDAVRVIQTSTSYRAVLHYRLAHQFLNLCKASVSPRYLEFTLYTGLISSRGKLLSGAEIHERCHIGRRFVLDHGIGTVIGETTRLGEDCYVLGGVTLGSRGIADNGVGQRHPIIGDRVQIGAFAKVFGPVSVGDDCFIGPQCVISKDLKPGTKVTLDAIMQYERPHIASAQDSAPSSNYRV